MKFYFSPPHYSDLQPIETVLVIVKGTVGRQYTTEASFKNMLQRLKQAFDNLKLESVQGCINKANTKLMDLFKHLQYSDDESTEESSANEQSMAENEDSYDTQQEFYV